MVVIGTESSSARQVETSDIDPSDRRSGTDSVAHFLYPFLSSLLAPQLFTRTISTNICLRVHISKDRRIIVKDNAFSLGGILRRYQVRYYIKKDLSTTASLQFDKVT